MKPGDLYHTGIVVDDLDETLAFLGATSGYRWASLNEVTLEVETPSGDVRVPLRLTYSLDEPLLEVIEAVPGTIWDRSPAGVHHLGYWSDDVDADVAILEAQGAPLEARSVFGGTTVWAYCRADAGPRIELVSRATEPAMRAWWAGGPAPGTLSGGS